MTRDEAMAIPHAEPLLNGRCVGHLELDERYGTVLVMDWHDPGGCEHLAEHLADEWRDAFDELRAAGLEADADHPIAAKYRAASDAVNHANRKLDFAIVTGRPTGL